MLDTGRYYLALVLVVTCVPALVFWFVVHPFASIWRRVGPLITYTVAFGQMVVIGYLVFTQRAWLMAAEYGTNRWLWGPAVVLYATSAYIEVEARRHLELKILVGLPEIAPDRQQPVLLDQGIYGRVRHPRYLGVLIGLDALSLFCNYLALYVLLALCVPFGYLLLVAEERELRDRFGQAYAEYSERVPRFFPRLG